MSKFNLANKLIPAKKAWKSFTKTLQSKLPKIIHKLKKSIKKFKPIVINLKPRSKTRQRLFNHRRCRRHHYHHITQMNTAAIYVDNLFSKQNKGKEILSPTSTSSGTKNKVKVDQATITSLYKCKKENMFTTRKGVMDLDEAWKGLSLPKIRGVDEKAEEFISKFREDMKLQREQSLLDFQEMLARGL